MNTPLLPLARWLAILLSLITLALFLPAIRFDFVALDDGGFVYNNPHVISGLSWQNLRWALTAVHEQWWLPLLWISYLVDVALFGPGPAGFHFTNILLHAANAGLLFWLLVRLTRAPWRAFLVAAIFALHPLRVESVAWISERRDVLSGLFFFLALLAHVRWVEQPTRTRQAALFLLMLMALLSKATALIIPPLLLLLDFWPLRRATLSFHRTTWAAWKPLFLEKSGLFVLSVLFLLINLQTHVSATGRLSSASWGQRLSLIAPDYLRYIGMIFWPARLCSHYPPADNLAPGLAIAALAVFFLLTGAALRTAPRAPWLTTGWLWFLIALAPMIRGIRFDPMLSHADRYTYLAGIGLTLALVWTLANHIRSRLGTRTAVAAGALLLAALAWKTSLQLPTWRNSLTLYQQQAAVRPDNHIAHNNYGRALLEAGRAEDALPHFLRVIELRPDDSNLAAANYADALLQLGREEEAVAWLRRLLAERNSCPPEFHLLLGLALLNLDRAPEAVPHLQTALSVEPDQIAWRIELARAHFEAGQTDEATAELQALRRQGLASFRDFDSLCAHYAALAAAGEPRRAWLFFRNNLRRQPDNILLLNNAAWLLATTKNPPAPVTDALQMARRAAELAPAPHPGILDTLAAALAANGQFDEAIHSAQQARDLALATGNVALAHDIQQRLDTYRYSRPWQP